MAEESKDKPRQILEARLDEQLAKARMILDRLNSMDTKAFGKEAEEFGRFMELAGQVQADSSWVTSMMDAGIPYKTILKV